MIDSIKTLSLQKRDNTVSLRVDWQISSFERLRKKSLYEILHLRSKVFVVEQNDVYLDIDFKDPLAIHILGKKDGRMIAYCRVFRTGTYYADAGSIGRVLVDEPFRGQGICRAMIQKALEILQEERKIVISAQLYLQSFYEEFGFRAVGDSYYDGNILHIRMEL